ncbi:MAG: DUF1957 domain-containing protein [Anaerolineales bacterium]|nr:DUF1957 domain-containing protein [Anaerolineales bacterium]
MAKLGAFTFVLHSHMPYARQAGRWPHGEEWLHEATAETYIPLLNALNELVEDHVPAHLTLSLTPILLEQLADEDVRTNFEFYLNEKIKAASQDIVRFEEVGESHFIKLATFYRDWYEDIRRSFSDKYDHDLVGAFRNLQKSGMIEIITSAATHGYLPLLNRDESINLQLRTAVEGYKRYFGRSPRAIWLPESAYRPGYIDDEGRERPGLEQFLSKRKIKLFFTETHMIEGGRPVGVAAGEAIGPYGAVMRRYLVPFAEVQPSEPATTFRPYYVSEPNVAVIGRNNRTGLQVWSSEWGYPGEHDYREFHKKDGISGMQYWRVTGAEVDLAEKDAYHPEWAAYKVGQHADHFAHLVETLISEYQAQSGEFGIISANYDTELFGHWWFEGVEWIKQVLLRLATSEIVELTTASSYLRSHPPDTVLHLPEGSWGAGGTHFVWDNTDNRWMWPIIHGAEKRMLKAVQARRSARGAARKVLDQAARELLLLQSSDWPFLVTTGQAREYAIQRFRQHAERFDLLLDSLERNEPDADLAEKLWERDKVFPEINYRWFEE